MNKSNFDSQKILPDEKIIRKDVSKDLRVANRNKIKSDFDYSNERKTYDNSSETNLRSYQETHLRKDIK